MIASTQYKPQIVKFITYAGRMILLEEVLPNGVVVKYYALESMQSQQGSHIDTNLLDEIENKQSLKKAQFFREYDKMVPLQAFSKDFYLFNYVKGDLVEQKISDARAQSISMPRKVIEYYISQLLQALYQLHCHNILGRQFSTANILDDGKKIIMMDFGFFPDFLLQTDCIILQSPEIVSALYKKQKLKYTTKLDSWLLGAFLYNLVKLKPITTQQFSALSEYYKELEKMQQEQQTHISSQTSRYGNDGLCDFIDQLLVFDEEKRLSFLQIHQCEYVKNFNIPKSKDMEQFYLKNENSRTLLDKIQKRELSSASQFFNSNQLQPASRRLDVKLELPNQFYGQQIPDSLPQDSRVDQPLNSRIILLQQGQSPTSDRSVISNFNEENIAKRFFHNFDGNIRDSKYYKIFLYIQMEQYRCFMLKDTANDVEALLMKTNFGLVDLTIYFLTKMCYLIMKELLEKLKSENFPWSDDADLQNKWQGFRNESQKQYLELNLIKQKGPLENSLKQNGTLVFQKYFNDPRIDENIKSSLQSDYNNQFNYIQDSNYFIKSGFRSVTAILHKFLCQESNVYDEIRVKYYGVILKAVFCHLINHALDYKSINSQFVNLKPQNNEDKLTPQEINDFIVKKDNDKEKIKQINYLMNKYFS